MQWLRELRESHAFSPEDLLALEYFIERHTAQHALMTHLPRLLGHWGSDYRLESWLYTADQLSELQQEELLDSVSETLRHFMSLGVRPLWAEDFLFTIRILLRHADSNAFPRLLGAFLEDLQGYNLEICHQVINLGFSFATHVHTRFLQGDSPSLDFFENLLRHHLERLSDASPEEVSAHYRELKLHWDQLEVSSL